MKKNTLKLSAFLMFAPLFITSCASIFGKSSYPVSINSNPNGANLSITDKNGKEVYKEEGGSNAATFRGGWHHEVPDEPLDLAPELQEAWAAYIAKVEAEEEDLDVAAFLQSVEQPGWVAFEITTCGMACGPVWETTWTVLDLSEQE